MTTVEYYDGLGRKLQTRSEAEDGQVIVGEAVSFNARQSVHQEYLPYFADTFDFTFPEPSQLRTEANYDALGRVIRFENSDEAYTTQQYLPLARMEYDEEDNTPTSDHADTPKTLRYDGLDRLIRVEEINDVDGITETYTTSYTYDLLDNLTVIEDDRGNLKTMIYDGLSRKLFMDDPDMGQTSYRYDDVGNLITKVDAKGQIINFVYDAVNRVEREEWELPDGPCN